jgi:hypothetical protein
VELKKILFNCKRATYLIEKRQLENITLMETCGVELHLKGCSMCKTYMKQSVLINDWIRKVFVINDSDLRLEDKFKKELQDRINALLDKKIPGRFVSPNSSEDPKRECNLKGKNRHTYDRVG